MKQVLVLSVIILVSIPSVHAEDNWYGFLIPYRLNIGLTNDQTSLTTSLDRDLTVYDKDGTPYPDQNSEKAEEAKKEVCHKTTGGNVAAGHCRTRKNDEYTRDWYNTPPTFSISLDTTPNYIWAGLGYNLGLSYVNK